MSRRQAESRQEQQDADAEAAFSDRALYLMDEGDRAQDDEAIAKAPAFHVGRVGNLFIYRAEQPSKCQQCGLEIAIGELFTSVSDVVTIAQQSPTCEPCRPSMRKGLRQEKDVRGPSASPAVDRVYCGPSAPSSSSNGEPATPRVGVAPPINNPHMIAARLKKAEAIIGILQKHSISAEQAEGMTDRQWDIAAKAARVNVPSLDTQRLVVDALRRTQERKTV